MLGRRFLGAHSKLPIVITENSMSSLDLFRLDGQVHDQSRIDFLTKYLIQLRHAIDEGIDVRGFFYWTIMDDFEWREGDKQRFGLIHVDFTTQCRTLKGSANWYRDVIASSGCAPD